MPNPGLDDRTVREIHRLRQEEDLSYRQIADRLDVSLGAVGEHLQEHEIAELMDKRDELRQELDQLNQELDRQRRQVEEEMQVLDADRGDLRRLRVLREAGLRFEDLQTLAEALRRATARGYNAERLVGLLSSLDENEERLEHLKQVQDRLGKKVSTLTTRRRQLQGDVEELEERRDQLRDSVEAERTTLRLIRCGQLEDAGFAGDWREAQEALEAGRRTVDQLESRADELIERIGVAESLDETVGFLKELETERREAVQALRDLHRRVLREVSLGLGTYRLLFETGAEGLRGALYLGTVANLGAGLPDPYSLALIEEPVQHARDEIRSILADQLKADQEAMARLIEESS